jgi:GntR family transcriptional regulator/MocR family aminotransferase
MIQKIRQQSWEMRLHLAERKEKTIFLKLANQIIQEILSGRLRQGTRLQGSRTLADELGINRKTVQSVYEDLEAQGWLVSKPRQGTFVSEHLPDLKLESPTIPMTLAQSATESSIPQEAIKNDGIPDTRLIPYELFSRAYRHALIQVTRQQIMGYGEPQGCLELRQALLNMLSMERFIQATIQHICVVKSSISGGYTGIKLLNQSRSNRLAFSCNGLP